MTNGCLCDIHLIWDIVGRCNFRCSYCLANSQDSHEALVSVDIQTVSSVLDATKRTFEINLVGGEPALIPNFLEVCRELTRKHHLFLSTNLSRTGVFRRVVREIDPSHITGIDASFHVEERERKSSFEQFAETFGALQDAGFPITANYVAHPRLMSRIESDFKRMRDLGVELKATPFIGHWEEKVYPEAYSERQRSMLFDEKAHAGKWEASVAKGVRDQYCNAGYNVFWVARDGTISKCTSFLETSYGNIFQAMQLPDTMMEICNAASCSCPYYSVLSQYFEKARIACGLY